jgi:hypothetical protein
MTLHQLHEDFTLSRITSEDPKITKDELELQARFIGTDEIPSG